MIGIVGGTFDPIHNGHVYPVLELSREIAFDRVQYVLSARPPHRIQPVASADHRFHMLKLALAGHPGFYADDQEVHRPGPSFTVWTLRKLKQKYPDHTLCLILGLDAFLGINSWHRSAEVFAAANFLVLPRPGWEKPIQLESGSIDQLTRRDSGVIAIANSTELPIAASEIRRQLADGGNVEQDMVPAVSEYIYANNLYVSKCNE